jgi:hypothetical protein
MLLGDQEFEAGCTALRLSRAKVRALDLYNFEVRDSLIFLALFL